MKYLRERERWVTADLDTVVDEMKSTTTKRHYDETKNTTTKLTYDETKTGRRLS